MIFLITDLGEMIQILTNEAKNSTKLHMIVTIAKIVAAGVDVAVPEAGPVVSEFVEAIETGTQVVLEVANETIMYEYVVPVHAALTKKPPILVAGVDPRIDDLVTLGTPVKLPILS